MPLHTYPVKVHSWLASLWCHFFFSGLLDEAFALFTLPALADNTCWWVNFGNICIMYTYTENTFKCYYSYYSSFTTRCLNSNQFISNGLISLLLCNRGFQCNIVEQQASIQCRNFQSLFSQLYEPCVGPTQNAQFGLL